MHHIHSQTCPSTHCPLTHRLDHWQHINIYIGVYTSSLILQSNCYLCLYPSIHPFMYLSIPTSLCLSFSLSLSSSLPPCLQLFLPPSLLPFNWWSMPLVFAWIMRVRLHTACIHYADWKEMLVNEWTRYSKAWFMGTDGCFKSSQNYPSDWICPGCFVMIIIPLINKCC